MRFAGTSGNGSGRITPRNYLRRSGILPPCRETRRAERWVGWMDGMVGGDRERGLRAAHMGWMEYWIREQNRLGNGLRPGGGHRNPTHQLAPCGIMNGTKCMDWVDWRVWVCGCVGHACCDGTGLDCGLWRERGWMRWDGFSVLSVLCLSVCPAQVSAIRGLSHPRVPSGACRITLKLNGSPLDSNLSTWLLFVRLCKKPPFVDPPRASVCVCGQRLSSACRRRPQGGGCAWWPSPTPRRTREIGSDRAATTQRGFQRQLPASSFSIAHMEVGEWRPVANA